MRVVFAAARFADKPEGLTFFNREIDAVNRLNRANLAALG